MSGLQIFYEIHDEGGVPLVVFHGGIAASEIFAPLIAGAHGRLTYLSHICGASSWTRNGVK